MVNTVSGELTCLEGTLYLSPGGVAGNASLVNNGRLTLANGCSINRNGGAFAEAPLTNNGVVRVTHANSQLSNVDFINTATGLVTLDDGSSLLLPSGWTLSAGRMEGTGTFAANSGVTNSGGTVAPGTGVTTGTLRSSTRYTQTAGGTLEIGLVSNGITQTADRLQLVSGGFNGQATLGGTLRVTLPAGTTPLPIGGVDLPIVDAPGGLTGQFTSVVVADPIDTVRYMVIYTPTQAVLRVLRRCGGADLGSAGADSNFDGVLDNNDFIVFIGLFFANDPLADVGIAGGVFGSDGLFDNNDFIAYIDLFFDGCG